MIRIGTEGSGTTLRVAGDLVGDWAAFLERECVRRLEAGAELSLDLSDLKRVDDAGLEALRRLKKSGARIARCPRVVSELIGGPGP